MYRSIHFIYKTQIVQHFFLFVFVFPSSSSSSLHQTSIDSINNRHNSKKQVKKLIRITFCQHQTKISLHREKKESLGRTLWFMDRQHTKPFTFTATDSNCFDKFVVFSFLSCYQNKRHEEKKQNQHR